jgi:hypothetical protein
MVLVILLWIQHIVTCANNTLAIFNWSSRYIILINAEDVELVCRKVKADGMGLRLRKVFFAAVASYWKQGEAVMTRKAEGWNDILAEFPVCRVALMATLDCHDALRGLLLKLIEAYVDSKKKRMLRKEGIHRQRR